MLYQFTANRQINTQYSVEDVSVLGFYLVGQLFVLVSFQATQIEAS